MPGHGHALGPRRHVARRASGSHQTNYVARLGTRIASLVGGAVGNRDGVLACRAIANGVAALFHSSTTRTRRLVPTTRVACCHIDDTKIITRRSLDARMEMDRIAFAARQRQREEFERQQLEQHERQQQFQEQQEQEYQRQQGSLWQA